MEASIFHAWKNYFGYRDFQEEIWPKHIFHISL